jgi:hypothetical protein
MSSSLKPTHIDVDLIVTLDIPRKLLVAYTDMRQGFVHNNFMQVGSRCSSTSVVTKLRTETNNNNVIDTAVVDPEDGKIPSTKDRH